jgi:hypothetical protein
MKISSELVQLKLNITRFYEVKYALDFGGDSTPTEARMKVRTHWNAPQASTR